ncbi:TPA: NAD(P)H-dependent oxidoreductase [Haemophilus influenzae]
MTQLTREQVLELFHQRSSTRYYDPTKKISDEDFECILECGRLSPSSVGSEPWKFLVIQNKTLREKMKPFSWGMINQLDNCSHLVVILAKKNARYDSPFFVDVMARKGLNAEQQQAALANMLTGASALGIDSCPIEGFHYDKMNECLAEEGLFDPQEYAVSVAATFGYRSRDIAKKSRKTLDEVVRWVG